MLLQLALVGQGRTASWNSGGGAEVDYVPLTFNGRGDPVPLGPDEDPAGYYARRWDQAEDDESRARVYEAASEMLRDLRRAGAELQHAAPAETLEEFEKRIVTEGEGWPAQEVAIRFRTGVSVVRKARENAGRETDRGMPPRNGAELPPAERDAEIRRMHADEGRTGRQIARALTISYSTVLRALGTKD